MTQPDAAGALPQRALGMSGLRVSVLGFGGAPIGFAGPEREPEFRAVLERALDAGVTFFDTAPDYRGSESLLGDAIAGRRDTVILATKCGRIQEWEGSVWRRREDWSELGVLRMIEGSLRRLRTDVLDLVQLHSPPAAVLEDGDAQRGLLRAQREGLTRLIGVSADGHEARLALSRGGFATLQISYSILQQEPGQDILPLAARLGVGLIIKQPLANGIAGLQARPEHPDWSWKWDVAQRMDWSASRTPGDRTVRALRWLLANPLISTAIAGASRLEHLEANIAAVAAGALPAEEARRIEAEYEAARAAIAREEAG